LTKDPAFVIDRVVDQVKLLSGEQDEEEEEMNNRNQWNVVKPLANRIVKSGAIRCHPDLYNHTWVSCVPCSVWTGLRSPTHYIMCSTSRPALQLYRLVESNLHCLVSILTLSLLNNSQYVRECVSTEIALIVDP
jgi:hypothetical protein